VEYFSEESVFIAKNWETVQDIIASIEGLETDLSTVLDSLAEEVQGRDWWQEGWECLRPENLELYVSRVAWRFRKDHAVWIGVEALNPDSVFGDEDAPLLYVWTPEHLKPFNAELVSRLASGSQPVLGRLDYKPSSGYVVTDPIPKCPPGGLEGYADVVREQVLEFIDHYARVMMQYDDVIRGMADEGE